VIHMGGGTELTNLIFIYGSWCRKSPGDERIMRFLTYRYVTLILLHSLTCAGTSVHLGNVSYCVGCWTRTEISRSQCMR